MAKFNLSRVPTIELRGELERRSARFDAMEAKRSALLEELKQLESELGDLEAAAGAASGKRHRRTSASSRRRHGSAAAATRATNKLTLAQALQQALKGKTMSVGELVEAVQRAGYKSNANNFRMMVNLTLLKRKDLFRKTGRGQYTSK